MSLLEGVARLLIFLGYLLAISRIKDIRRVFMYHGAEHKTIACYEAEGDMTPENILKYTRLHPRCGTNYLFLVMMVSILFFACIPVRSFLPRLLTRLLFIPVVAGLAYEVFSPPLDAPTLTPIAPCAGDAATYAAVRGRDGRRTSCG